MIGQKDLTMWRMGLYFLYFVTVMVMSGCSVEKKEPSRLLRIHDQKIKGVAHATHYYRGERFCSSCHGNGLAGGSRLEPSCYTCHGKAWLDSSFLDTRSPSSHTEVKGGFSHAAGFMSPEDNCASCHGLSLQGTGASGPPPCLLCHEKLW